MEKRELRRELFSRVRALPIDERGTRSATICKFLAEETSFRDARVVFAYLALPGEPDLSPLLARISGQQWAFSRVTPEDRLVFHTMERSDDGTQGSHGIHEPDPERHAEIPASSADLILVPGVGFDPVTRGRLGRGRGHYDRFLASALATPDPPRLVGIAFSVQLTDLITESHDVPMDRILTDQGWI